MLSTVALYAQTCCIGLASPENQNQVDRYMKCMKYPMIILDPVTHRLSYMELTHVTMETEESEDVQTSPRTLLRT